MVYIVEDVMTKAVVACLPSATIVEVRKLMANHRISRIVVIGLNNEPIGILTQKDIVSLLHVDKSRRVLEEIQADEVMSKDLITVKLNTSMSDVASTMLEKEISSLIIVDEHSKLKGIVTKADVCMFLASKSIGIGNVSDFMTSNPVTVKPSHPMSLAVSLMSENNISRVIVADKEDKPVGIITLTDLTMTGYLLKPEKRINEDKTSFVKMFISLPTNVHLLTAEDVMTIHPVSINKDRDIAEAAKLMTRHNISGLPVINDSGKLVGIVTKSDLTRAVASMNE